MAVYQDTLTQQTRGRGTLNITQAVEHIVRASGITTGTCHVFQHHTSASLLVTENADPDVRHDLETLIARMAPDGDPAYRHDMEGDDDMAAHARAMLTHNDLTVPVGQGRLILGTWQGLFLWEHRYAAHTRKLTITVQGE
ncbi:MULTISPECIES: secondary thiamine-phosphate synthase enzyme YjbQ [unclassified Thioalkalivibrio]|uniref:secondary thiamine-phosphate synthase enzyme YjbQ n=1 Tax=unclassified Thioalkalivibrio TaxID=2621013 RepID=UPI000369021D|nr:MULTISPECIES: secondary thiamine-phosphate synthase enzyme YjbQ [unclassified Thioalkalivibrio]